jgi:hypothetical protein
VVDSHHQSSSEAHECDNRLERFAIGPEIHDSNLSLGGAVGSFDGGFEGDSLLQEIEMPVGAGDGLEFFVGWGELNSLAGKGVKRLEEKVFALMGKAFYVTASEPVVEEDGFRDRGVVEVWKGEFADAEIPVGMAGPFNVEWIAIVEREMEVFALEFVDDGSVVDPVDGNFAAGALIEEAVALLAKVGDVDGGDVEFVFVDVEIGKGLLVGWVDFEEDYVFRVVVGDDDVAEELPVSFLVEAVEMPGQVGIEVVGFNVLAGEDVLIAEDGGEGLKFD